jgi:hypothetical protein
MSVPERESAGSVSNGVPAPEAPEALDLMSVARGAVVKRALPAAIVLAVVVAAIVIRSRR